MKQQRGESMEEYVARLEREVAVLRNEVRLLKSNRRGNRTSKAELRQEYGLNEDDVLFSDDAMTFAAEYLFPRFKFLHKGWTIHDPTKKKGLSMLVKRHLPIRKGKTFAGEWDKIIAPAIAKKYTDTRCNMNNKIRNTFLRKYYCVIVHCSIFHNTNDTNTLLYCYL